MKNYQRLVPARFLPLFSNERTATTIVNIVNSSLLKGGNIVTSLLIIPVTLNYVDSEKYGIWITLSSIIAWFNLFDLGLGHGLKNKLSAAIARGDTRMAKTYVSTTYALLILISAGAFLVFLLAQPFISWTGIVNVSASMESELKQLVFFVFTFFLIQFVVQTIHIILTAYQKIYLSSLLAFLGSALSLLTVYILTLVSKGNLIYLGIAYSFPLIAVYIGASILFYRRRYRDIAPSIRHIDFKYAGDLAGLGVKFFVITVAWVILFQTTNVLLARMFGPTEVARYNIASKYYSILHMGFALIINPLWVAFTDAYVKNDIGWIRATLQRLIKVWGVFAIAGALMLIFSKAAIQLWVGDAITYDFTMHVALFLYYISLIFGQIFTIFLNGSGKIQLQFLVSFITPFVFLALAIVLGRWWGPSGVIAASIICNLYGLILAPLQVKMIISGKAKGIWNR